MDPHQREPLEPYAGEPIASYLMRHQFEASDKWRYGRLVTALHYFAYQFNRDFALRIPPPVIGVDRLRRDVIAHYRLGRNAFGLRTEITFNERHLSKKTFKEPCRTLIHEMCHGVEEYHYGRVRGGRHHSRPWRDLMETIGVTADDRGQHLSVGRFDDYLKKFEPLPTFKTLMPGVKPVPENEALPSKQPQLGKWLCGCEKGYVVRAWSLNALCRRCGFDFVRVVE